MLSLSKMAITQCSNAHAARNRRLFCAAALGSLAGSHAFVLSPPIVATQSVTSRLHIASIQQQNQQTRLFFSNNNQDDDWSNLKRSAGNLVKKGAEKLKSILPFGKTEEEKQAAIIKKEQKEAFNSMFKDMPFPIRMAGKMIAPLLSKVGEEIAEQSRAAQGILDEARVRLVNDSALRQKLGEPLQVGSPFSQSSSSMSINGKSTTKVQASFQVIGPYGSGVATMDSSNGEINSLVVNVNGVNIFIGASTKNIFGSSTSSKNADIIEAEIIEKK
jgi:hypothetical protein